MVMGICRKIIAVLLIVVATVAIIGVSVESTAIYQPLVQSFTPFNFGKIGTALATLLTGVLGMPLILLSVGLIGLLMPNRSSKKNKK